MIRCIAALDSKNGIADDHGIPWAGKLPKEVHYYLEHIKNTDLIMGYGVYVELSKPYNNAVNYVATTSQDNLREAFTPIHDARKLLQNYKGEIWDIGGAGLFASTIDLADELHLTRIQKDFHCTKFFPPFEDKFELVSRSDAQEENGITYYFEIWKRK